MEAPTVADEVVVVRLPERLAEQVRDLAATHTGGCMERMVLRILMRSVLSEEAGMDEHRTPEGGHD